MEGGKKTLRLWVFCAVLFSRLRSGGDHGGLQRANVTAGRTMTVTLIVDPSIHRYLSLLTGFVAQHYATGAFDPDTFRMAAQLLEALHG